MEQENVYGREKGTENIATANVEKGMAQDAAQSGERVSAVPEKFKDVDALARAYAALQSEFTRRSQRLKELEKTVENFQMEARDSGAEKLRKNAAARKRAAKAFDEFVAAQEVGKPIAENTAPTPANAAQTAAGTVSMENGTEKAMENRPRDDESEQGEKGNSPVASIGVEKKAEEARQPVASSEDAALSPSEALYRNAVNDEKVRLRIIGEYLASIGRSAPPLTTGSVGTLATPSQRAKSIGDAGAMALQYLKNE